MFFPFSSHPQIWGGKRGVRVKPRVFFLFLSFFSFFFSFFSAIAAQSDSEKGEIPAPGSRTLSPWPFLAPAVRGASRTRPKGKTETDRRQLPLRFTLKERGRQAPRCPRAACCPWPGRRPPLRERPRGFDGLDRPSLFPKRFTLQERERQTPHRPGAVCCP